jgi:hypothetical protein
MKIIKLLAKMFGSTQDQHRENLLVDDNWEVIRGWLLLYN